VRADTARARAIGTKSGKAIGRTALAEATTARIVALLRAGRSESAIVTELGVGKGTRDG
jgi:hypothetical protein